MILIEETRQRAHRVNFLLVILVQHKTIMGCANSSVPGAAAAVDPGFASMLSQFSGKILATTALKSASTKAFAR